MKNISNFIVEKRYYILFLFIIFTVICGYLSTKVNINFDIAKYLPKTSETRIGMNIMEDEFKSESSSFNIMFENLSNKDKKSIYKELSNLKNISNIEYDNTDNHNKDKYTLYVVNLDFKDNSKEASNIYKKVKEMYKDYDITTSGSVAQANEPVLKIWIVILAVVFAIIILIIMCDSYFEPFLYLAAILIAVVLNKGTNIIFDSVSDITISIVAVLQMALSMDYSIMLNDRYKQEKKIEQDKIKAMKNALYHSFKAISSSSVTTIVGLLVLVFMSFTIGRDLGFVLAKGVLFSLISIFFCLPGLLLLFDKVIDKTHKKVINFNLTKLGRIIYKVRIACLILFISIFLFSFFHKGNLNILYTGSQNDKISNIFKENNQMAIIYDNKYEDKISDLCKQISNNDKVKSVMCYGNTLNEELKYNELNNKLKEYSSNSNISNDLLKIVYYTYYNKDISDKLSLNEFINFLKTNIYTNEELSKNISSDTKSNIYKLNYFINNEELNKERDINELSNILNIDKNMLDKLLILYNSQNNTVKLSLNEFINFIKSDVLTHPEYSSSFSSPQVDNLNMLLKFTDKEYISDKYDYKDMSKVFNMDLESTKDIYLYYILNNNIDTKLTLNEFSNYVLNNLSTNPKYSSYFDSTTLSNIDNLYKFSNKEFIQNKLNDEELTKILDITQEDLTKLKYLYYQNSDNGIKYTISELIDNIMYIKLNSDYLNDLDTSSIEELYNFKNNQYIDYDLTKENLYNYFDETLVNTVYSYIIKDDNYKISPHNFINIVIDNLSNNLDLEIINKFILLKNVLENNNSYSATDMSSIIPIEKELLYKIYTLIYLNSNNSNDLNLSIYEVVNTIISNNIELTEENKIKINLLNVIMNATLNNKEFNYIDLSKLINIDENKIKTIYSIYILDQNITKISPLEFINYILNTEYIKSNINNSQINNLYLIKQVMEDVLNNKKYISYELSNLLSIDKNNIDLLYGLYSYKYNNLISINDLINFIYNYVITNSDYSNNFNEETIDKIAILNNIIISSKEDIKYTSNELYDTLSKLNNVLNKDGIDLVYMYYGYINNYNESWTLTIEKLINYLNNDLLNNNIINNYINKDMSNNIKSYKELIDISKLKLVGNNYSRIVINTNYELEGNETFNFIQEIKDNIKEISDKDIYIIGDSPMAYEMSKTFNSELNFITILTMIAIFIVVAITFKSLIIPLILVLIIQCSVYLTMGIMSFKGDGVYFIALLIVQSILMGATIDYAILYTSYYIENRKKMDVKNSVIMSYNKSISTILTSSLILMIVTLIVGNFASVIASKICITISLGTLCSTILIIFLLPGILSLFDKIIIKMLSSKII